MTSLQLSNSVSLLCHCTLVLVYGSVRRWLCMKSYLPNEKKKLFVLGTDGTFFAVLLNLIFKFSANETWPLSLFFLWTIWAISLSIVSDIWLFSLLCIVRGVRFSFFSFYIYNPRILMWGFTWQRIECHCFFHSFRILVSQGRFFMVQSHVNVSTYFNYMCTIGKVCKEHLHLLICPLILLIGNINIWKYHTLQSFKM